MILCLFSAVLIGAACEGNDQDFDLTVINDPQSTQAIRVDLGGEVRTLNFGDGTIFRMVRSGRHILSVDSPTCAGTARDTLMVNADLTVRIAATQDISSGECRVQFSHSLTPKRIPLASAFLPGSSNGRTRDFGSWNRGSNPRPGVVRVRTCEHRRKRGTRSWHHRRIESCSSTMMWTCWRSWAPG